MGFISSQKSKKALERYREMTNRKTTAQKRSVLRNGLRLEKLDSRVVFSGASAIAVNDLYEAIVDEPLEVQVGGVLANDTDAEGDTLTANEFFSPKNGQLQLNEDGTFTYQPDPGFTGVDGFVYQVDDGTSKSSLAAVTIEVNDPNIAPEGANDFYSVEEDGLLTVLAENGVVVNDSDENGDSLIVEMMSGTENGEVELLPDGSFTYAPDADFNGTDAFTYRVSDGEKMSDLVVVELEVAAVNDAPQAVGETFTIEEDGVLDIADPMNGLLSNDSDMEESPLILVAESMPEHGQLTLNDDGTFNYIPEPDYHGMDSFSYRVSDGEMESEPVIVDILVTSVHDAPVAGNDFFEIQEDEVLAVSENGLLENDQQHDAEKLMTELVDLPQHGVVELNEDGTFEYTPDADFNGVDAFTYRLADATQPSDLAVVEILVESVNDAPITGGESFATDSETPISISMEGLLENDYDVDGDELTHSIASDPEHGSIEIDEEGNLTYTPDEDFVGEDAFTYEVSDGLESTVATVAILVNAPITEVPGTANESFSGVGGETLSIDAENGLLANEERDGDLEVIVFRGPEHGEIAVNSDGSFEYTPEEEFEGVDSILYRTTDGEMESRLGVATIYVTSPATSADPIVENPEETDAPVADSDLNEEGESDPVSDQNGDHEHDCWDEAFADIESFWFDLRRLFS